MEFIAEIAIIVWNHIKSLSQTMRIWDIFDILIIAFLIYRVLSVMRKTSASSVIKGIVFVLLVAWVANILNMIVLSYIIGQALQMGILVIVVLFQPELRKLLEQVGNSRLNLFFRRRVDNEALESVIANVAAAVVSMSKEMTGAIIVFERSVGLNDYAVSGTKVDAQVSSELLQNIFYHNSPLHDGAALLRDGRLLAAACMMPLSNNINLGRDLGMRHRAAVGISERSDAVAVIVSEQNGSISVAVDGMLKRHLSGETLEMLLRSEIIEKNNFRKRKKKPNPRNAKKKDTGK